MIVAIIYLLARQKGQISKLKKDQAGFEALRTRGVGTSFDKVSEVVLIKAPILGVNPYGS